jgi:hypothetical protein
MPVILMKNSISTIEAFDVMNSGYKGKIDLLGIGFE